MGNQIRARERGGVSLMAWLQQLSQKRPTRQGLFGLLQLSCSTLASFRMGDVGVGVFPDLKEVLVPPLALAVSPVIA